MNLEQRIEDGLRRRPSDERIYAEPLAAVADDGPGPVRMARVRPRRTAYGSLPVLASLFAAAVIGGGLLLGSLPHAAPNASGDPRGTTTIDLGGPVPEGALPLGAVQVDLGGSTDCSFAGYDAYAPIQPAIYNAVLGAGFREANLAGPVTAAILKYEWPGYGTTLASDSAGVTTPDVAKAFRPIAARIRLLIDSPGNCYDAWTVTARSTLGYDGAQDDGGWTLLGDGRDYTDQAVVSGLPDGDWMIHIHLEYDKGGTANWTDSYARVIVGGKVLVPAVVVPAPNPAADCSGQTLTSDSHAPAMSLTVAGAGGSASVTATADDGKLDRGPSAMPGQVVTLGEGSAFTIRTKDGSCGEHLNGLFFFATPADSLPRYGPSNDLPYNDGSNGQATVLVDSVAGIAPARGQWIIGVAFSFGGPNPVQYFWRVSVVARSAVLPPAPPSPSGAASVAPSAAATSEPATTPWPAATYLRYTVTAGDYWSTIAAKFGVTPCELQAANQDVDPNTIMAGQSIKIPNPGAITCTGSTPAAPSPVWTFRLYQVKAGDMLLAIAMTNNLRLCELVAANPGITPDHIEVGQSINIPVPGAMSCVAGTP